MAKDSIGSLALLLSADSSGLAKDLAKAEAHVKGFAAKSGTHLSKINPGILAGVGGLFSKAFAPLAAGLGVAGLTHAATSAINDMVELEKESRKLGISIEDLSALMTIEGPDFVKGEMLTGLRKLGQELEEAVINPTGEAAETLKLFGLNAEDMIKSGTLQSLKTFADTMHKLGNENERLKLGKIMGKEGHSLIPFLGEHGSSRITAEMSDAVGKGLVVTKDMAKTARDGALALDAMGDSWEKLKRKFATDIGAPAAKKLGPWVEKTIDILGKTGGENWEDMMDAMFHGGKRTAFEGGKLGPVIARDASRLADGLTKAQQQAAGARSLRDAAIEQHQKKINKELDHQFDVINKTPAAIERIKAAELGIKGKSLDSIERRADELSGRKQKIELENKNIQDRKSLLDEMGDKLFSIGKTEAEITVDHAKRLGIMGEELNFVRRQAAQIERAADFTNIRNRVASELAGKVGEKSLASDALVKGSQEDIAFGAQLRQPRFTVEDAIKAIPDALKSAIEELNLLKGITDAIEKGAQNFADAIQVGVFN